jgi:uncharacterized sulfatase
MEIKNIYSIIRRLAPYTFSLFIVLGLIRMVEFHFLPSTLYGEKNKFTYELIGLVFDLSLAFFISFISLLISLLHLFIFKTNNLLYNHILSILILLVSISLSIYFINTNEALNETIFHLKWKEIVLIASSGDKLNVFFYLQIAVCISCYFIFGIGLNLIKLPKYFCWIYLLFMLINLSIVPDAKLKKGSYTEIIISSNKLLEFAKSTFQYLQTKTISENNYSTNDFKAIDPAFFGGRPILEDYPLLHNLPKTDDLGKFFNKTSDGNPPNIVFIIVESLNSCLVGDNAYNTGHIMPFLDSLSSKSLYFPNFLSTCDRTHNVLPAALASVPNPPDGKLLLTMEQPLHWSLISLLKKQYYSRFYCGVELNYSNMNGYMNFHKTDYLVKNWEPHFTTKLSDGRETWGFPDDQLFRKSVLDLENNSINKKSRLDVLLTISTHDPFIIPNQKKYIDFVEKKIKSIHSPTQNQLDVLEKSTQFSTYAYTDASLKKYFELMKKDPSFKNTIFLIFGDHGNQFCLYNELERFKSTLLIYSPLLKKSKKFNAVSTHLDIAPSILNYLRLNYLENLPSEVPFIGKGLDLNHTFKCNRLLPINAKLINDGFVFNDYYLTHNQLYKIGKQLKLRLLRNNKLKLKLEKQLKLYGNLSNYVHFNDKFLPKLFYKEYCKADEFYSTTNFRIENEFSTKEEYINIGSNLKIASKVKTIKLVLNTSIYLNSKKDILRLPNLTLSIKNIVKNKDEIIVWKQVQPVLVSKFKKGWNEFSFKGYIRLDDYKKLHKQNELSYYLFNKNLEKYRFRNINCEVFYSNN